MQHSRMWRNGDSNITYKTTVSKVNHVFNFILVQEC